MKSGERNDLDDRLLVIINWMRNSPVDLYVVKGDFLFLGDQVLQEQWIVKKELTTVVNIHPEK